MKNPHNDTLSYGQFYGAFQKEYRLSRFSIALIAPDDKAIAGINHSHECDHIIFVLNGQYIASSPDHEQIAPVQTLVYVPAGTTHNDRVGTSNTLTLTVSVSRSQMENSLAGIRLPRVQSAFRHGEVIFLASRLSAECRRWRDTSPLTAEGLCLELLGAIAKRSDVKTRNPPSWLRTARDLLHDKCQQTVTVSDIAQAAGVHPIHLARMFRKFFNCTPGEYLRDCRLELAASLLRDRRTAIAQVASEGGFADQSHFSKAFKRKFGATPVEFRRTFSKNV